MNEFVDFALMLGGLITAAAVAVGCGVVLFVWLAGSRTGTATEAWPPADER
jgi:hypothetical protein